MFRTKTAGPAPAMSAGARGFAGAAGLLARVVKLAVGIVVLIIVAIAVNWGIAAVVYLLAGGLIVRLIGRTHR